MLVGFNTQPNLYAPQRTPFSVFDNSQFQCLSSLNLLLLKINRNLPMVGIPLLYTKAAGPFDKKSVRRIFWETKLLLIALGGKLALH